VGRVTIALAGLLVGSGGKELRSLDMDPRVNFRKVEERDKDADNEDGDDDTEDDEDNALVTGEDTSPERNLVPFSGADAREELD